MRVIFGATALQARLTGIGQYAMHLANGLRDAPDIDLTLFTGRRVTTDVPQGGAAASSKLRALVRENVPNAYGMRRAFEQWHFDREVRRSPFDLYHEPSYLALRYSGPTVITVHDLSWIRYPETHPVERVRAMNRYFEPILRRSTLILTDSEFVGREVKEVFGIPSTRIRTVPLGLDPVFRPMSPEQTRLVLERVGLRHGGYFLSVGTLEPRKNIQATLAAYSALPQALRARMPLVVVGMKGWGTAAQDTTVESLTRRGELRLMGYLDRSDLAVVTAGALAMVYPSWYEGFGFPVLEAMGAGVPPISSNVSSLPEVVGDAGLTVAPDDVDALKTSMRRLADDATLRESLSNKALQRAGTFSWARCVTETADAYRLASRMLQ